MFFLNPNLRGSTMKKFGYILLSTMFACALVSPAFADEEASSEDTVVIIEETEEAVAAE